MLGRFNRLSKDVEHISLTNLAEATVYIDKDDEVGRLGSKINHILALLSELQKKEKDALQKEREANDNLRMNLEKTEKINRLMVDRELKMTELKKEIQQLQANNKNHT